MTAAHSKLPESAQEPLSLPKNTGNISLDLNYATKSKIVSAKEARTQQRLGKL